MLIDPRPATALKVVVIASFVGGLVALWSMTEKVRIVGTGVAIFYGFGLKHRIVPWSEISHLVEAPEVDEGGEHGPRVYYMAAFIVSKNGAFPETRVRFQSELERENFLDAFEENGVTVVRDERDPREAYLGLTTIDLP